MRRFLFRLCLAVGVPHPDYLNSVLDSAQLSEWMAYDLLEPFGDERADLRSGMAGFGVARAMLDPRRGYKLSDFMPHLRRPGDEKPAGDLSQLKSVFRSAAAAFAKARAARKKQRN